MEIARLILCISAMVFVGFNILYLFFNKFDKLSTLETVFLSYGMGLGFISLEIFLFYMKGFRATANNLMIPWLVLFIINIVRLVMAGGRLKFAANSIVNTAKNKILCTFLSIGIGIEVSYSFFRALIKPIEAYDAIAIYAIKAKIFYLSTVGADIFNGLMQNFPHPDYPLNIPLSETFAYIIMGGLNEQLVKIIFPLFFCGILVFLYNTIRRFASKEYALLFTFILATIPQFNAYSANAYLEVPLAFYIFASVIFLLNWISDKQDMRSLIVSAILVGLGAWTKNEGLLYCVISISVVTVIAIMNCKKVGIRVFLYPVIFIIIIGAIAAPWMIAKSHYHIVNDEINLANINPVYLAANIGRLGPVLYELQKQLFGPKKWNIFWIILFFILVVNFRKIFRSPEIYLAAISILAFCGYILFYMISYVDAAFFASKTWSRFLLDFLPILILLMAYLVREDVNL